MAKAVEIGNYFKINWKVIPKSIWKYGLEVELEHGKRNKLTNITNDNLYKTARIVIAHLSEFPDYYQRLKKMEKGADKYWSKRKKNNLFRII